MLHFLPQKLDRTYFLTSLDEFYFYDDITNEIRILGKRQVKNRLYAGEQIDGLTMPSKDLIYTDISASAIYSKDGKPCIVYGPVAIKLDGYVPRFYFSRPVKLTDLVNKSQMCFYGYYRDIEFRIDRGNKSWSVACIIYLNMKSVSKLDHSEFKVDFSKDISIDLFTKEASEFVSCLPCKREPYYRLELDVCSTSELFDFTKLNLDYTNKSIVQECWEIDGNARQLKLKRVIDKCKYIYRSFDGHIVNRIDCSTMGSSHIPLDSQNIEFIETLIDHNLILSGGMVILPDDLNAVDILKKRFSSVNNFMYLGEIKGANYDIISKELDKKQSLMILAKGKDTHNRYILAVTVKKD